MLLLNHTHSPMTTTLVPRAHEDAHEDDSFAPFESKRPDPDPNPPHHRSVSAKRIEDDSPSTSDTASSPRNLDTLTPRHLSETSDIKPHPAAPLAKAAPITDPSLSATLLIDYLAGYTAARLCASYNITLPQLFAWRRSPETQELLKEHKEFAAEQARHVQADKEPEIILTLCAIATRGTSESECRRAASDLLRAFKFRDYLATRRPRNSDAPARVPSESPSHNPSAGRTAPDRPSDPCPHFRNPLPVGGGRGWVRSRTQQSEDTEFETPVSREPTNNPSAPSDPLVPSNTPTDHPIPQLHLANCDVAPHSDSSPRHPDTLTPRHLSDTSDIRHPIEESPRRPSAIESALIDHRNFSPDQQSHEAYTAAADFNQQLARKNPPPDH